MKPFAATLTLAALTALPAQADTYFYKISGTVDLSAVNAKDLAVLGLTQSTNAPFAIEMVMETDAPDIDNTPERGAYRVNSVRISFAGNRLTDPEKSVQHVTRPTNRNKLFEVHDHPLFDAFAWTYAPRRDGPFRNADRVQVGVPMITSAFDTDALPTRLKSSAQWAQISSTPNVVLTMNSGASYTMPLSNSELISELRR